MQQQTIVSILGIGLVLWWMSSGRVQIISITDQVAQIKRLASPWLDYASAEKRQSVMYANLRRFIAEADELVEMSTANFREMRPRELERYLDTSLPRIAQSINTFERIVERAQDQIDENGVYVDGPFEINQKNALDDVDQIIDTLQDVLGRTRDLAVEILKQVGYTDTQLSDLTQELDVLLSE